MDAAAKAARFERPTPAAVAVQQAPPPRIDVSVLTAVEQRQLLGLMRKVMGRRTGAAAIGGSRAKAVCRQSRSLTSINRGAVCPECQWRGWQSSVHLSGRLPRRPVASDHWEPDPECRM